MSKKIEHKDRAHAVLAASSSHQWINCPPSIRLGEEFEDNSDSDFAKEGTLAHELAEVTLRYTLGMIELKEFNLIVSKIEKSEFYTSDMPDEVQKYVDFVIEELNACRKHTPETIIRIEDKFDLTDYIPEGFGTSDATIISNKTLKIIDLKYGRGIRVDAIENAQLMLYALGALKALEFLGFDFDTVEVNIAQPRLNHYSTYKLGVAELIEWGESEVKPKAKQAFEGKGEFRAGEHCKWCKAKSRCRKLHDMNREQLRHDFCDPALLSDEELLEVYKESEQIISWVNDINKYILKEAEGGKAWPGYKLVEGRANRKWADEEAVMNVLSESGYKVTDYLKSSMKGIGDIEKLVGKDKFPNLLNPYVVKPPGKPTLAPSSDKRQAIGESLKDEFGKEEV